MTEPTLEQVIENQQNVIELWAKKYAELEQQLAEAKAKIPQWIPVTERLPKPRATVLAVDNSGDIGVCTFVNTKFVGECLGFEVYLNDGGWDRSASKVIGEYITHWMPLPEPPNNGENAG